MLSENRILRLPEVIARTGLSRSTIYILIGKGEFPSQVKLGARSTGWRFTEIEDWINSREAKAPQRVTAG